MKRILIPAIAAVGILGYAAMNLYSAYGTAETVNVKISKSERVNDTYMIFTATEVFKNTDTWWYMKFNSSDVYNKAVPGMTCEMKVNGFRVPFFSMYRNVISVKSCA